MPHFCHYINNTSGGMRSDAIHVYGTETLDYDPDRPLDLSDKWTVLKAAVDIIVHAFVGIEYRPKRI